MTNTSRGNPRTDDRIARTSSEERGQRGSSEADLERTLHLGTMETVDELNELDFDEFQQEALPTPPKIPGFHCCWLSTTSTYDPISKRIRIGYSPVTAQDVPGFEVMKTSTADGQDGLIRCNEMALFKIPMGRYMAIMKHFHHDRPLEDEQSMRQKIEELNGIDQKGRGQTVMDKDEAEGLASMVNRRAPQFAAV